jgi:hypothetical protein
MTVTTEGPVLLKPRDAAKILLTSENSLAQDRFHGRGVPYIKLGFRVLYDRDVIIEYLRANTVTPAPRD